MTTVMSTGERATVSQSRPPIAGPLYRRATQVKVKEAQSRKLLCLLAAYLDAGERSPQVRDLSCRLDVDPAMVDQLLRRLARERLIYVAWRPDNTRFRNAYWLLCLGDARSKESWKRARQRRAKQLRQAQSSTDAVLAGP